MKTRNKGEDDEDVCGKGTGIERGKGEIQSLCERRKKG